MLQREVVENRGRARESCKDELDLHCDCLLPTTCIWEVPHPSVCTPSLFLVVCSSLSLSVCLSFSVSTASALLEFLVLSGAVGVAWL